MNQPYSPRFTPTEQRIIDLLADGLQHTRDEMLKCLHDDMAAYGSIKFHVYNIRRKIVHIGQYLVVESLGEGGVRYRLVNLLPAALKVLSTVG